jgi:ribonuclease BN (tRNA processing enzyme)
MQVTIVPSSPVPTVQMFVTYLINGVVAIDGGALGAIGTVEQMARVKNIFLTHSHLDHVAGLPPFIDAVYDGSGDCVVIHGPPATLECLKSDVFNNRLYPDFLYISTFRPPYLKLSELRHGQTVEVSGLRITALDVNHVVPTTGYLVDDGHTAALFPSDTGPTDEIWNAANGCPHLKAVFLECTFPNSMAWLADLAKHMTPELYAAEMKKLQRPTRFITVHMHSRHRPIAAAELMAMNLPNVELGEAGRTYTI